MGICSITCVIRCIVSEETKVESLSKDIKYNTFKKNVPNVHKIPREQKHKHSVYKLPNDEKTSISPISLLRPIKSKIYINNSDEEKKKKREEADSVNRIQNIFRDEYMNSHKKTL